MDKKKQRAFIEIAEEIATELDEIKEKLQYLIDRYNGDSYSPKPLDDQPF